MIFVFPFLTYLSTIISSFSHVAAEWHYFVLFYGRVGESQGPARTKCLHLVRAGRRVLRRNGWVSPRSWPRQQIELGVGLRRTQRGQCVRVGLGSQTGFLCFPKPVENHYIFAFCRLWGKVLLVLWFFWLELHQCGEKGRVAVTCISVHITNTVS